MAYLELLSKMKTKCRLPIMKLKEAAKTDHSEDFLVR